LSEIELAAQYFTHPLCRLENRSKVALSKDLATISLNQFDERWPRTRPIKLPGLVAELDLIQLPIAIPIDQPADRRQFAPSSVRPVVVRNEFRPTSPNTRPSAKGQP